MAKGATTYDIEPQPQPNHHDMLGRQLINYLMKMYNCYVWHYETCLPNTNTK